MVNKDTLKEPQVGHSIGDGCIDARFSDFLTVKGAADVLGVSTGTIRRWDSQGKLKAHRHPVNNYRLYRRLDLEKLLTQIRYSEQLGAES